MYCVVYQMLLSVSSCDVNVPDNDHTTPLIMAAMQGNRDMCEILVSKSSEDVVVLLFNPCYCFHGVQCTYLRPPTTYLVV